MTRCPPSRRRRLHMRSSRRSIRSSTVTVAWGERLFIWFSAGAALRGAYFRLSHSSSPRVRTIMSAHLPRRGIGVSRLRMEATQSVNDWVALFSGACARAARDAENFEERIAGIQAAWTQRLGAVRAHSAVNALIKILPGAPVLTVKSAVALTKRSLPAINQAITRLIGCRCPGSETRTSTQPNLRGPRDHRSFHRVGTGACKSRWGHTH